MKKVIEEVGCVRCNKHETTLHVLRDCEWAVTFWNLEDNPWVCGAAMSFKEWLAWVIENHPRERQEAFAMKLWQVWKIEMI